MYFPFFILHDWGKRSAEACSSHLSGVALVAPIRRGERENLQSGCQGGNFCTKKKLWQKLQFRKKLWEV